MSTATTCSANRGRAALLGFAVLAFTTSVSAGELSCRGEVLTGYGQVHTIDLSVKISADGRVHALRFSDLRSDIDSDNPLAVHACSLDTELPESYGHARWSGSLAHQRLELVDAFDGERSSIKITKRGNSYDIQFETMSRSYCGQMSFPAAVVISAGSDQCSVQFPSTPHRMEGEAPGSGRNSQQNPFLHGLHLNPHLAGLDSGLKSSPLPISCRHTLRLPCSGRHSWCCSSSSMLPVDTLALPLR